MIKDQNQKLIRKLQQKQQQKQQLQLFRYNKPLNKIYSQVKIIFQTKFSTLKIIVLKAIDLRNLVNFPKLTQLQKLDISKNKISQGFNHLIPLKNLQYLDISKNIITQIHNLRPLIRLTKLKIFAKDNPICREVGSQYFQKIRSVGLKTSQKLKLNTNPKIKNQQQSQSKSLTKSQKKIQRGNNSDERRLRSLMSPAAINRQSPRQRLSQIRAQSSFRRFMAVSAIQNLRRYTQQRQADQSQRPQNIPQQAKQLPNLQRSRSIYDIISQTFSRFFKRPRQQRKVSPQSNLRIQENANVDSISDNRQASIQEAKRQKDSSQQMQESRANNPNLSEKQQAFSSQSQNQKQPDSLVFARSNSSMQQNNGNESQKKENPQQIKFSQSPLLSESSLGLPNKINNSPQSIINQLENSQNDLQQSKIQGNQLSNNAFNQLNQPESVNTSVSQQTCTDNRN